MSINQEKSNIGIVIPAYNPDMDRLTELIDRLTSITFTYPNTILIVDDGSDPPLTVDDFKPQVELFRHDINQGKGAALITGFQYFSADQPVLLIVTLDADLQHPPEMIPSFIRASETKKSEIIIGCRRRTPKIMPLHRIFSNTFTSLLISLLCGQLVRDSQSGFRLIKSSVLNGLVLKESGFHLESELLIKASWNGCRIGSVKIPTIYGEEKSSIQNTKDTLNFLRLILKLSAERLFGWYMKN